VLTGPDGELAPEFLRTCIIMSDEMRGQAGLYWNGSGELVGLGDDDDQPADGDAPVLADKVLVFYVRNVVGASWMASVAFWTYADESANRLHTALDDVLSALDSIDLVPLAYIMDGSAVNMQLLSMYADTDLGAAETADSATGCSRTNTWSGRPLYLILDPVHAFKNQRNSIASSGLGGSSGRSSSASSAGGGAAGGFAADSTVCGSASAPGSAGGGPGVALGGSGGGGWPGGTLGGSGSASAPGSAGGGPGIALGGSGGGGWPGGTLGGSGFASAPGSAGAGSGGRPGIAPGGRKRGPPPTTAGVPSTAGAGGHKYIRTLWRRGHWIGWPHWLALYHSQLHAGTEQIALAHKLTTDHLYLRGFLKMNVRLAAQACSGRVAFGLQQAAEQRAAERGACDAIRCCCFHSPFCPPLQVADGVGVGVGSLRRRLLAAGADNFRLEAADAFGQSEALTMRLKHITCVGPVPPKPCCKQLRSSAAALCSRRSCAGC